MSAMIAAAKKRISQETFDEVVAENIDDFDMAPTEALAEAVKQFTSQGVDLRNIDTSGGIGKADMEAAMAALKAFASNNDVFDANVNCTIQQYTVEQQAEIIKSIGVMCDEACEQNIRNREMMNPTGINSLLEMLAPEMAPEVLTEAITLLTNLSKVSEELRDFFEPGGSVRLSKILSAQLQRLQAIPEGEAGAEEREKARLVLRYSLALARAVAKSENNKNMLARTGTMDCLAMIIVSYAPLAIQETDATGLWWSNIVSDACVVLKGMCVHDDIRREMSCAMDNGKFFLAYPGLVGALMSSAAVFATVPTLAGQALAAAKTLITTEDAVKTMTLHGAMTLPAEILAYPQAENSLVRNCLGFMRNLCADDVRKDRLVSDGSMRLCVAAMSKDEHAADWTLMEHGAACLAAMSLRSPSNSYRIAETGAIDILVKGMRKHPMNGAFQRQCALCMRNIAARCTDLRSSMLDAGAEDVLRAAGRLQEAVDEAYAALRDLGCEVHKVKIGLDGTVEAAYEQFGEKKSAFKAIWDDAPVENQSGLTNIEESIQREARAPFEGGRGQGATRPATKKPFQDEEIEHYGADDDMLGHGHGHAHEHVHGDDCDHGH